MSATLFLFDGDAVLRDDLCVYTPIIYMYFGLVFVCDGDACMVVDGDGYDGMVACMDAYIGVMAHIDVGYGEGRCGDMGLGCAEED